MPMYNRMTKNGGWCSCVPLLLFFLFGCLICTIIITKSELEVMKNDIKKVQEELLTSRRNEANRIHSENQAKHLSKRSIQQYERVSDMLFDALSVWFGGSPIQPIMKCILVQSNQTKCSFQSASPEDTQNVYGATLLLEEAISRVFIKKMEAIMNCSFDGDSETKCAFHPGSPGADGQKGDRGEPGLKGERGRQGNAGVRGMKGDPGVAGPIGSRGMTGEIGIPGPPGAVGQIGEKGAKGQKGESRIPLEYNLREKGQKGERGASGFPGPPGLKGQRGDTSQCSRTTEVSPTTIPPGSGRMVVDCNTTYECRSEQLICTQSGDCTVNCRHVYSCLDASITCSGSGRDCIINCDGDRDTPYSCLRASMTCPARAGCTINCVGLYSCRQPNLLCQQGSACTINCQDLYSCIDARIVCPDGGSCNINCSGQYGCRRTTVLCDAGTYNCNINCSVDLNSCQDMRVTNSRYATVRCCEGSSCSKGEITRAGLVTCS